ncbi:hypothetical protein BOTBODRAFT_57782 [Botryobasidium botryosum FD-172 SS1]|uniref:MYND-type domain-containing protein n=1 Tax=Botryobasidium botryosum (strain FD-172 SS1) TaxID=930990 RepID=A0A067MH65_BOTB1|nr:hypothetical protein BOTBODRAFT_57782 [Botryobasidium botryosum FD-172 SS1]
MAQRPSLASQPDAWERAWQADLDRKFPSYRKRMPSIVSDMRPLGQMMMSPSGVVSATERHNELCTLQADLTKMASDKCATEDFEGAWKRCSAVDRQHHYMVAMAKVCEIPDMEDQRTYAPEVTLKGFQAGGGQGYLDLLRKLMLQKFGRHFVHVENPLIESMLGVSMPLDTSAELPTDPLVFVQKGFITNRTIFITLVVWNILLSFYDRNETLVSIKNTRNAKLTHDQKTALKGFGMSSETMRSLERESKEERKHAQSQCKYCGKLEVELNVQFKSCARCSAARVYTKYCSRDCQVADWKRGTPPHKTICGQPAAVAAAAVANTTGRATPAMLTEGKESMFDPPAPGYLRSPALLHQISMLEQNAASDYVLMRPHPHPDYGVTFSDAMGRIMFHLSRARAMSNGDPQAVRLMYNQLSDRAEALEGVGLDRLRKQLQSEYGIDPAEVGDAQGLENSITADEVKAKIFAS